MASSCATALAEQFERVVDDLVKQVEQTPEAQWRALCGDEGWTVAATAHHVGAQWPLEREYLDAISAGSAMPSYTWDDINAENEKHAKDFSSCSKADVIKLLRDESSAIVSWVRGLSDEQLDRSAAFPLADGASVTTKQLIEGGVLIDHAVAHLKSLRAVA